MAEPLAPEASTISCPQCGGENPLPSGERFVECQFCDATLFVDRGDVVGHYQLPRLLDAERARAELRRWMTGNHTVKDLDRKSTLETVEAVTFPMWMFRVGREGEGEVLVEPAAPTPIPQLVDLDIPAGRLEPFRAPEEGAEAVSATIPLETARRWLDQRGRQRVRETALVDVPLWRCRYRFDGQSYTALVDGSTGSVLAAVFPEKSESPYVVVAILGLLLFVVEGLVIQNPLVKLAAYGVTAVPLLLVAWWVTRTV